MGKEGMVSICNQMGSVLAREEGEAIDGHGRARLASDMELDRSPNVESGTKAPSGGGGRPVRGWNSRAIKTRGNGLFRQTHRRRHRHTLSLSDCGLVLASPCFFLAEGDRIYEGGEG